MPCTITQWEVNEIEKNLNEVAFGKRVVDREILEEVACQMARTIYANRLEKTVEPLVEKWIEYHRQIDKEKGRKPWRRKRRK